MRAVIGKGKLEGTVRAIPSKSYAHRYLICAGLSGKEVDLYCPLDSEDILATADCLRALGTEVRRNGDYLQLKKGHLPDEDVIRLMCRESGSTLRFMLPVVAAMGGRYELYSEGRLPKRPLSPLYEELTAHGAVLGKQGMSPLSCEGKLRGGVYTIPGNISSQYISGLLFALPLLEEDSVLRITETIESSPYIDLTIDCLERSGIDLGRKDERTFYIKGKQDYDLEGSFSIEGDWSNAAFFLVASALTGGKVVVNGLREDSIQGDRKILSVLKEMGFVPDWEEGSLRILGHDPHGIVIDAKEIPDIIPPLSLLACGIEGTTKVINAGRLALKESDRLEAICSILGSLGADIENDGESLTIRGTGSISGGNTETFNDHRMVMMAATASVISRGDIVIKGTEAVRKSYPGFFEDLAKLGGRVTVL